MHKTNHGNYFTHRGMIGFSDFHMAIKINYKQMKLARPAQIIEYLGE